MRTGNRWLAASRGPLNRCQSQARELLVDKDRPDRGERHVQLVCRHDEESRFVPREGNLDGSRRSPKKPPMSLLVDEIRLVHTSAAEDHQAIEADIVDLVTLLIWRGGLRLGRP